MKTIKLHIFCGIAMSVGLHAHSANARSWTQINPGRSCAQSITASPAGVWVVGCNHGIGNNGAVYWLNSNGFQRVTSSDATATQVGASVNGNVWVISEAGRIGQVASPQANGTSAVNFLPTGVATQNGLAVDSNGSPYVRGTDGNLWLFTGGAWVSFGSPGGPQGGSPYWVSMFSAPENVATVTVQSGYVWQATQGWIQFPGAYATLIADHMALAASVIWYYDDNPDSTPLWTEDPIPPPVNGSGIRGIACQWDSRQIFCNGAWVIDTNGNIFEETN